MPPAGEKGISALTASKTDSSPPPFPSGPPASVGRLLTEAAGRFGHREFLRCSDRSLTFADAERETGAWARGLAAHGARPGDRVAIMLPNDSRWPLSWLAILRSGRVAVPVNHAYRSDDLEHVLDDSGALLVLTDADTRPLVEKTTAVRSGAARVLGVEDLAAANTFGEDTPEEPEPGGDDLANLQYTSGTSGFPKACMLTHDYWVRMGEVTAGYAEVRAGDVALTAQPFSYIDPMWNTMMCLTAGIPLVVLPRFSASGFWADVRAHRATLFYVLGGMPVLLYKRPPHPDDRNNHVRLVMCSGIVPELHASLEERWGAPWREAYGLTETGVDLSVPIGAGHLVGSGKIGYPVTGKTVQVVDENDRPAPAGVPGEIVTRGVPMMRGYWNQPEKTAEAMRGGWFHTGDLGVMDDDGAFRIVGRLKDMVRRGGENVACAEVEQVLDQHPGVVMSAVAGIPDEMLGEEVKAYVQAAEGHPPTAAAAADIVAFARDRLARFKVPRRVEFVDDFPLTPSARVSKPALTARKTDPARGYVVDPDSGQAHPDEGAQ